MHFRCFQFRFWTADYFMPGDFGPFSCKTVLFSRILISQCCHRLHDAIFEFVSQPKHYVNPMLLLGFCNVSSSLTVVLVCADTTPQWSLGHLLEIPQFTFLQIEENGEG